jgi:hypothetical protein
MLLFSHNLLRATIELILGSIIISMLHFVAKDIFSIYVIRVKYVGRVNFSQYPF